MRRALVSLMLAAACRHGDALTFHPDPPTGPFSTTPPLRLTYNAGQDAWAAWSADGLVLYYSVQDSFSTDKDRCIARIPAGGGARTEIACPPNFFPNDTTEIHDQPAPNGNQIAFASSALGIDEHGPFRHALWLVADSTGADPRLVQQFPYLAPSGQPHDAALFLQWLSPGVLLYLGAENGCCRKDTLRFGEQIVLLDLSGPTPARTFVPNTTRASSVQAGRDGASIVYTFYGDSRVYRQILAGGGVTILHDFGTGRIVRDAQVAGNRLIAVVDGIPQFGDSPPFLGIQVDYGGLLSVVDLTTGIETRLPDRGHFYKHPVFSPSGTSVVVEAYPVTLVPIPGTAAIDTVASKWADLWRLEE